MRRKVTAVAAAFVLLLALAACGGGESVGSDDLLDFEEQGGNRIGDIERKGEETTTSTTPPTTRPAPTTAPPTTRAAPTTTSPPTTAAPTRAFTVKIISGGQGFDPFNFAVKKGTPLRIENTDSQARTFTSDQPGVFDSGPIPPGGSFSYVANTVGKFNFHDETRPFAVGQMEVTP